MELRHATPAQLFRYLISAHSVWAADNKLWGRFTTQEGQEALVVIEVQEQ